MQAEVGINNADQGHVREVQSFGDHLGADEDVDLAGTEVAEDAAVILLALEGVGVHALDSRVGEKLREGVLDALGAQAGVTDGGIAAFRLGTRAGSGRGVAANVAK